MSLALRRGGGIGRPRKSAGQARLYQAGVAELVDALRSGRSPA